MSVPPPLPKPRPSLLAILAAIGATLAVFGASWLTWQHGESGRLTWPEILLLIVGLVLAASSELLALWALWSAPASRQLGLVAVVAGLVALFQFGSRLPEIEFSAPLVPTQPRDDGSARYANSTEGVPAASRPIVPAEGTLTLAKVIPLYLAWSRTEMTEPYLAHGQRNPAWDEPVGKLIEGTIYDIFASGVGSSQAKLRTLAGQVRAAGCTDPLVLFLAARVEGNAQRERVLLAQVLEELPGSAYPPAVLLLARLEAYHLGTEKPEEKVQLTKDCLETLRAALTERPLENGDYWTWQYLLTNGAFESMFDDGGEALCDTVESIPQVAEWLQLRLRGLSEINLAWLARSSGWAKNVSEAQWRGFAQHLKKAQAALERSWELHREHPAAATEMIQVAMAHSDADEMRYWFDQAIAARLDFGLAYAKMRWGLRARWCGSEQALLAFGHTCLATGRFDTGVPWELLQATRDAASEWDQPDAFYRERARWPELREMFTGYLEHGAPEKRAYYASVGAIVADKCGDRASARQWLETLSGQLDPAAAREWKVSPAWAQQIRVGK